MTSSDGRDDPIYACGVTALGPEQRARHAQLLDEMTGGLPRSDAETPTGLQFTYALDGPTLLKLAEWIDYERQCCPFLAFDVAVRPERGEIVVHWSGPDARAKAVILASTAPARARAGRG